MIKTNIKKLFSCTAVAMTFATAQTQAASFTSNASGDWSAGGTWSPATPVPDTGGNTTGADSVIIDGHAVTFNLASFPGPGDGKVLNGNSITIRNGGSLQQNTDNQHFRVGDGQGATSGTGTLNIEDGTFNLGTANAIQLGANQTGGGNGILLVGDGVGAQDSAVFTGGGSGSRVLFSGTRDSGNGGNATIIVENDGLITNMRPILGNRPNGVTTMTVNGNGEVNTRTQNSVETIADRGVVTLNLNDNALWTTRARNGLNIGHNAGSTGTVNLNDNSTLRLVRNQNSSARTLGVGYSGSGTLNINDNATVTLNHQLNLGRNATGRGTVNHNSGTLFTSRPITIARINGGQGTYILTDGSLQSTSRIDVSHDGQGTVIQNGGTASFPLMRFNQVASASGTYNLNGGTLRSNTIQINGAGTGVLNWGSGTLTMYEVNSGSAGTTEYSTAPIIGENVRSGTTIAVDGDLTTGFGGGTSVLELGVLYKNSGTRSDILELTGALDLSGADQINAIGSSNLLRPVGGLIDYGTIPLVTAAGGITGEFDTYGDIFASGSFNFFESPFSTSDPSTLKPNSYYFETTGTQLLFHYKVTGTVPEPSTVSFLAIGLVFIRFVRGSVANKKRS